MFILAISPSRGLDDIQLKAILDSGIDGLMLREKQLDAGPLLALVRKAQELAPRIELWVNGRLDVALISGCGLHLPEAYPEVTPDLISISLPIHSEEQIPSRECSQQLLLGPIFTVPGKGASWGVERLHRALDRIPPGPRILALGGISPVNSANLRHPRLDGIALIGALMDAPDPSRVVAAFRRSWS